MDLGNSKLNPSSLLDLKAELHKKYESFRKAKLAQDTEYSKPTPFKSKLDPPKEKKKKCVPIVKPNEENKEEELALKKSRLALEAKSQMYERIVSSKTLIDDEQNENYLVDFQRKVLYGASGPEIAQKNDVNSWCNDSPTASFQNKPFETNKACKDRVPDVSNNSFNYDDEESGVADPDQPIHYQNIQYNEVRDHGTGYFAFSMDETKRKEQMEDLNSLRQETEEQRLAKQRLQRKRKAMLQSRLTKICERKNIDQSVLDAYKTNPECENTDDSEKQTTDLSSIPLPEANQETTKKEAKVRPWDEGKDTFQHFVPQKSKIKSQNEWIREIREERRSEFAPPSSYM